MRILDGSEGVFSQRLFTVRLGTWRRIWHMQGGTLTVLPTSKRFIAPKLAWCQDRAMDDDPLKRHLDEIERVRRSLDPMGDVMKQLQGLHTPMDHFRDQLAELCRDPLEEAREQLKALTDPLAGMRDQLKDMFPQDLVGEHLKALLQPFTEAQDWAKALQISEQAHMREWFSVLDDFQRQFREMPGEVRVQLAVLMARGWCLDPEMPHTWGRDLADAFEEGQEEEAQQWLVDYFKGRLDEIEKTLVDRHPSRAAIITDAFQAHREGRYSLSIPVMLTQADGVIYDKHQRQLFTKKSKAGLKELVLNMPADDLRVIFIEALSVDIPLTRRTQELPAGFDGLNRHAVLHGTDLNYGTEINGLRAVSILNLASHLTAEDEG